MKKETYGYKGWLNSDDFIKRVIAVTLYQMLGSFVISMVMMLVLVMPVVMIAGIYKFNSVDNGIYYEEDESELFDNFDLEGVYFDEETKQWMDDYGVCYTCTPENGFSLSGIETEEDKYIHEDNQDNDSAVVYNCKGEIIEVNFNNDTEPKTASLVIVEKNSKIVLDNVESASGARYSDGDMTFWSHQGAATLAVKSAGSSINCVEKPAITSDSAMTDENGNSITEGCKAWFDGCNTCQVGEPGAPMACTRKMCMAEIMEPAKCLDKK